MVGFKKESLARDLHGSLEGAYDVGSSPIYVNNRTYWIQNDGVGAVWLDTDNHWRIGAVNNLGQTQTYVYAPNTTYCPSQGKFWKYDETQDNTNSNGNCTLTDDESSMNIMKVNCTFRGPEHWKLTDSDIFITSNVMTGNIGLS